MPSAFNESMTIQCPTIFEKTSTKQIDTRRLNSSDVAALKTSDPFMFYSVPTLRRASFLHRDVDDPCDDQGPTDGSSVVKRQTRVSTECHPDVAMEDLFARRGASYDIDFEEEDGSDSDDDEMDFLEGILAAMASQKQT